MRVACALRGSRPRARTAIANLRRSPHLRAQVALGNPRGCISTDAVGARLATALAGLLLRSHVSLVEWHVAGETPEGNPAILLPICLFYRCLTRNIR